MRVVGAGVGVGVSPMEIVGMKAGLGFYEVIKSRDYMEIRRWSVVRREEGLEHRFRKTHLQCLGIFERFIRWLQ